MTKTSLSNASVIVRRITVSALLLALSVVVKSISSVSIPLFGENGMRVGLSGIFSMMPAFLFGPVYGAAASGLSDFLGWVLNPTGAYMPLMTLIVAAGGFIRGGLWMLLAQKSSGRIRVAVLALSVLLLIVGLCNLSFLNADGVTGQFYDTQETIDTADMHFISRLVVERTRGTADPVRRAENLSTYIVTVTWGVIASAALGLILLLADFVIARVFLKDAQRGRSMQLLVAMVVSGLIVTTLNTILLREVMYPSWKLLPFSVIWIPRVIEEILANAVKAFFVAFLLGVFQRHKGLRQLVKA